MSLTPQSSVDVPWHISDFQAIWKLDSLEARIDMSKPQLGIGLLRYQGKTLPGKMLGVSVRTENKDLDWILQMGYLRGNDLMATYRNSSCPQSTLQIDWRISAVSADEVLLKIDVVVSMHTESLESYPHITATTQLACDQFLYVTDPQVNTQTTILSTATDAQGSR